VRAGAECFERFENHVRGGFAGESVGTLDVMEVREQTELLQDQAGGRGALRGRGAFAPAKSDERFGDSGVDARHLVSASGIDCAVLGEEFGEALRTGTGEDVAEEIVEMAADVALEVLEG